MSPGPGVDALNRDGESVEMELARQLVAGTQALFGGEFFVVLGVQPIELGCPCPRTDAPLETRFVRTAFVHGWKESAYGRYPSVSLRDRNSRVVSVLDYMIGLPSALAKRRMKVSPPCSWLKLGVVIARRLVR